jgi:DoxX-like family
MKFLLVDKPDRKDDRGAWIIQGLLALIFLSAGGMKLGLPIEVILKQIPQPGPFPRFTGVAEIFGAFGLILPGLLRIWPGLTRLEPASDRHGWCGCAPPGRRGKWASAPIPLGEGLLSAFDVHNRWRMTSDGGASRASIL